MKCKANVTEPEPKQADVCCVKIPDKSNVSSIKVTLQCLVSLLDKQPELRAVKGIRLSQENRSIQIELEGKRRLRDEAERGTIHVVTRPMGNTAGPV